MKSAQRLRAAMRDPKDADVRRTSALRVADVRRTSVDAETAHDWFVALGTLRDHARTETTRIDDEVNRFGLLCHRLPLLIRRSGLARVVLLLHARRAARGDQAGPEETAEHWLLVLLALCLWPLLRHLARAQGSPPRDDRKLLEALRRGVLEMDVVSYCVLVRRTLELAEWYKRYAQSLLTVRRTADAPDPQE